MQKLKEANLYRSELITVNGKLVERYNECLVKLGFTKTTLSSFSIDGLGWSPEIAEEKKEAFYLNNGEANTHAIIITPLQKGVPVYNAFHSFDKELMTSIFKKHGVFINDITRDAAICIEFDQNIDVFYEPLDVLKYKDVVIKFHLTNNLNKAKVAQLKLIDTFNSDTNFIDESIHAKLLKSAKKFGDLRERKLKLEELKFTTDSFYTKAFGGVFILKDFVKTILIFEKQEAYKEAIKDTVHDILMYHISHNQLIERLLNYNIIEADLAVEVATKRYDRIKKYTLSSYLKETTHPVKDILQDSLLFKSYLNKIDLNARKKVMGLELFLEKKEISKTLKAINVLDENLFVALQKPHSSLKAQHQDLIWYLLVQIAPKDVLFLYWYDKDQFYTLFETLESSMQDWVIETIKTNF